MSRSGGRLIPMIVLVAILSACASHAPTVDCDKRLAPINVGETANPAAAHKGTPTAGKPKS